MTITQDNQVPAQATSGLVVDTTEEGATPAFMRHGAPIVDPGEALKNPYAAEVNRLNSFLMEKFPQQMNLSNRQHNESPVSAAIRLLSGMAAGAPMARCREQYCNLPSNHDGDHGYVQYQPR